MKVKMSSGGICEERADLPLAEVVSEAGLEAALPQLLQKQFQIFSEFIGVAQSASLQVLVYSLRNQLPKGDLREVVASRSQILLRMLTIDLGESVVGQFGLSGVVFVGSVEDQVQDTFGGAVAGVEGLPQLTCYPFNRKFSRGGERQLDQAADGHAEVFLVVVEGRGVGLLPPAAGIVHQLIMRVIHNVPDRLFGSQTPDGLRGGGGRGVFVGVGVGAEVGRGRAVQLEILVDLLGDGCGGGEGEGRPPAGFGVRVGRELSVGTHVKRLC